MFNHTIHFATVYLTARLSAVLQQACNDNHQQDKPDLTTKAANASA
ncbi:MAG: hypothetical protein LPH21_18285 [Shewanella sp.]|nr:hypothetical protein [Shewanella sp.]